MFKRYSDVEIEIEEENLNKFNVIYKFTFPNGKIYIGQTSQTLRRRLANHCCRNENTFKCRAINKYKSFKCEILYEGYDLNNQEERYINIYKTLERNFGYNLDSGGHINKHLSEETKRKISEAKKGTIVSEETKKKMSEAHKNNIKNNSKAVIVKDLLNNKEKEFISITEASKFYDVKITTISNVLSGLNKTFKKKQYTIKYK